MENIMANKKVDYEKIIGQKYNKLTVIGVNLDKGVRKRIICRCDCGNVVSGVLTLIQNGRMKSCGCKKHDVNKVYETMVGQKINKWTIIEYISNNKTSKFLCQCECGIIKVNVYNLINHKTKDCGCGRKKALSETKSKDLTGKRFGKLVAIEKLPYSNKFKRILYKCKCDCGNEVIVPSQSLVTHHTVSCGCLLSYYNMLIDKYLDEIKIQHKREHTVWIGERWYRFDFYLPTYNLLIEYDGEQHYKPVRRFKSTDEEVAHKFKTIQENDKIKNQYCTDNGINLLRIPYWEKKNIKAIIDTCLQRLNEKGIA